MASVGNQTKYMQSNATSNYTKSISDVLINKNQSLESQFLAITQAHYHATSGNGCNSSIEPVSNWLHVE